MRFLQQHKFILVFLGLLVFCSVMVIHQFNANQSRHAELLDAFILLQTKGYTNEARRLYDRLLNDLNGLPNKALYEDFQRTLMVVDPSREQRENPIWKYHWTVSNEMEKRSERNLVRALKLAEEN
jgi:hypothetical protein